MITLNMNVPPINLFHRVGVLLAFALLPFAKAEDRPNIILMMVDDLGYADFGCYGSEIETPHIDFLANQGLRFSQFYNTAKCHSSRICLLTGLYTYQAGNQALDRSVTVAEVLGDSGYATSMTGKWHLDDQPTDHGFQQYFGHLSGATDFFKGDDTFRINGEVWNDFDEDFYMTDANVDYAMEFIDNSVATGKPFFHYIAFNAPHYPLQAPKEDIEKTTTSHYGKMKKLRLQLAWHDSKACHKGDKIRIYSLFFDLSLIPFHDHARFECVGFTGGRNTCTVRHRHLPGHGTGDFHFNHRHIA